MEKHRREGKCWRRSAAIGFYTNFCYFFMFFMLPLMKKMRAHETYINAGERGELA